MVQFTNPVEGQRYDAAHARLREKLGELDGVSEETLEQIDRLARPSSDGPIPHREDQRVLYGVLVQVALAEAASYQARQSKPQASSARANARAKK